MSISDRVTSNLIIPAIAGGVAFAETMALGNNFQVNVPLVNVTTSAPIAAGVTVAASSFVGEFAKQWIAPMMGKMGPQVSSLLNPVLTGGANALLFKYSDNGSAVADNMVQNFLIGATAEMGASYLHDSVFRGKK